jgi:hypothetical protein
MKRFKSIVDIIGITVLLELYIWRWQASAPRAWIAIVAWLAASFVIHRDTPKTLGWRVDNLAAAPRRNCVGIVRSRPDCDWTCARRSHARSAEPQLVGSPGKIFWVLHFPASRIEFSDDKSPIRALLAALARGGNRWGDFCRRPLAESSPRAANLHCRDYYGLAFCARAQHPATCGSSGNPQPARLVGVSDCVAPRLARRTGLLHFHSMIARFN